MIDTGVKVWQEEVIIPTYGIGKPDKNPMFFEKRVYQGSSGVVYPNAVVEKIEDEKKDKSYIGLFLENRYLKIMILPELGGRIQMAYDIIKNRHFIYYNQVIKPALVGLTGPWISGGIEFNWPQHHRPSTFEPIDFDMSDNEDGSKTVWVNEIEKMFGTKGMAGFTLHPDKAYIEIKAKLYNRTALPQTFLWWANPAVKVNDHYQSIFPPDVNAVFDHGKRDVSGFPIATGTYYKVDYAPGTDISRYKNIPVPTSYMAINSEYDFMGGYEHDTKGGLLHVASHHVSPGKKQWTWGYSDFGQAWDRNLTDEDGPYIELMTGVFTDNQPDFSWLMPYEEKTFTQYFLPYRELGQVKNATQDILLALNYYPDEIEFKIMVTSKQLNCNITLFNQKEPLFQTTADLIPEDIFEKLIKNTKQVKECDLLLQVLDHNGKELISYQPSKNKKSEMPEAAKPAPKPKDALNNEELFLIGQHLEQYRHATYNPVSYYEEALNRDQDDCRCNNALGLWYLRRGKFSVAEDYFRTAVSSSTKRNPNPYDGEPYYNLGLCLQYLGRIDDAYSSYFKSTWSKAWQDTGFFSIAQLDMVRGDYSLAFEHINQSLDRNMGNSKAWVLKIALLRKSGSFKEAIEFCKIALNRDRFNLGAQFEKYLISTLLVNREQSEIDLKDLLSLSRGIGVNLTAYALDYAAAGLFVEAEQLLNYATISDASPMVYYHLAIFSAKQNNVLQAQQYLKIASQIDAYLCFPNRLEDIVALSYAIENNPDDAKALYYLGNLWYDKRQYEDATVCWEKSISIDNNFATVHRNLGIAYFNKKNDPKKARKEFEHAFSLDINDGRVLMELDQLYKRLNNNPEERLRFLEKYLATTNQRDDLYLERLSIYNLIGEHKKAFELLSARQFHPWEGGEGKVSAQYLYALTELAKKDIEIGNDENAINLLNQAQYYPHNLGEGKLYGVAENDIFYWLGIAHLNMGLLENAKAFFIKATGGSSTLNVALFYNDQQPDKIFYQGLAWLKIGNKNKAFEIFKNLVSYGDAHQHDQIVMDYFAVSLPNLLIFDDDMDLRNQLHCLYMKALGYIGLSKVNEAKTLLETILLKDKMHFGAKAHLELIENSSINVLVS